jgi:PPM family protein phosphatase
VTPLRLGQSAGLSDPGRRRRRNEDAYVCEPPLFAVADGMGGAQAGELASGLAAAALRDDPADTAGDRERRVDELIQEANRRVYQRQSQDAAASGMGTTMTVALVEDGTVAIGHVGDSRAYLIRERSLEQLTEDHSLVAELVRSGRLSPEEAEDHPQRSVITRALGTDPDVDVDTFSVAAKPGDVFLLCSDGLTSMVDDETILSEVERGRSDLRGAAKALVRAANRGGGEDNITVVFFEIIGAEADAERTLVLPEQRDDAGADEYEEKTLDELDGVPAVGTMVVSGEGERAAEREERREEPPRERRGPSRRAMAAALALVLLVLTCGFVVWGLWRSHFVGAESDGHVAVYQGVPWNIVGNVHLYRTVYVSPLLTVQLSESERRKLFDHSLRSEHSALAAVRRYEQQIGK